MSVVDNCVYYKYSGSKYIFLILYVLLATNDMDLLHEANKFMLRNFEIKDFHKASFVLGIQIHYNRS